MKYLFNKFVFCLALTLLFACGKDGDGSSDDGGGGGGEGGDIGNDPKNVTGRFFFESTSKPATGVELVLSNWTDLSMRTFTVKSDGSILVALSEFAEGQVYSFHLIDGDQKVADLDLSTNTGLQSAFAYQGGYGFDLGDVLIPKDSRGIVLVPDTGLEANIGGGFSIDEGSGLMLEGFPVPSFATEVDVQPSMVVSDAVDLYYGVLNPVDAFEIERVRSRYSAISFRVKAKSADSVVRSFIGRVSDWYKGAKVISIEFSPESSTVLWLSSEYALNKNGTTFSADVITGENVVNRLIYLKVEGEEPPQAERVRIVNTSYSTPPYLEGVSLVGGVPFIINYSLPTITNGLTTPFCHSAGDVVLDILPPKDMDTDAVLGDALDSVELRIDYFNQKDGITSQIAATTPLVAPFDSDIAAVTVGDYSESWQAATKVKTFVMGAGASSLTKHRLTLKSALFPALLGSKSVSRIKVKILFKNSNHSGKAGSVFWIRKDC